MRTTLIATLTLSFSLLLGGCLGEPSAQDDLESAKAFFAEGKSNEAVLELKNALRKDHTLGEARWLLGKTYLDSGNSAPAEKELERAVSLDWQPNLTIPAYGRALLNQGKFEEVSRLSPTRLAPQPRIDLYSSQALAKIKLGENSAAREIINKIKATDPDSKAAQLAQAQLSLHVGEIEIAKSALGSVLEKDANNVEALKTMGQVQALQHDNEGEAKSLDKVLAVEPNNLQILHKRTMLALQAEDYPRAERGAAKLLRAVPKDPSANFVMGFLDLRAKRYEAAMKRLQLAEPITPEFPQAALFLAQANLAAGYVEGADASATRFHNMQPESIRGRKLLTIVRLEQKDFIAAEELILPVARSFPDDSGALRLLANAQLGQRKIDEGITTLARVAQLEPDSADAQVRLGAGLLMDGEPVDARLHLETALELKPDHERADFLLILSLLQQGENEEAMKKVMRMAEKAPDDATPLNLEAWIHNEEGRKEEALAVYKKILETWPADPGANHALGQIALKSKDHVAAKERYEAILVGDENNLPALVHLALIEAEQGNEKELVTLLERAIEAHQNALQPRLMLARYYISSRQAQRVSTAFTGLEEAQRNDPEVLKLIAVAQVVGQEHSEALFTLSELNQSNPDSVEYYYLTGLAAAGSGDNERAINELEHALEINEDHNASRLALAKLLYREDRAAELNPHVAILSKNIPDNPDVLLLKASIADRANDRKGALAYATQAYRVAPGSNTALALGLYYEKFGEDTAAQDLYSSWLEENPNDTSIRLKLAMEQMDNNEEAEAQYRELLRQTPENYIALNNLAWILLDSEPEEALELAKRANEISPNNPSVLDTLAMAELENGNFLLANRHITRALEKIPDDPTMIFHSVIIGKAVGREEEARSTLKALLDSGVDFPELDEAMTLHISLEK